MIFGSLNNSSIRRVVYVYVCCSSILSLVQFLFSFVLFYVKIR